MLVLQEVSSARPVRALAAHVRIADHVAVHKVGEPMTADAGELLRTRWHFGRSVVRATRAEMRSPCYVSARRGKRFAHVAETFDPGPHRVGAVYRLEPAVEDLCDHRGVELAVRWKPLGPRTIAFAEDARTLGWSQVEEDVLNLRLKHRARFLYDEDLLESLREREQGFRLQRPDQRNLENFDAGVGQLRLVDPQVGEGLDRV